MESSMRPAWLQPGRGWRMKRGIWNSVPELKHQANSDEIPGEGLDHLFPAGVISCKKTKPVLFRRIRGQTDAHGRAFF